MRTMHNESIRSQLRIACVYAELACALEPGRVQVDLLNLPSNVRQMRECRRLVKLSARFKNPSKGVFHVRVIPGPRASVRTDGSRMEVVIALSDARHRLTCVCMLCVLLCLGICIPSYLAHPARAFHPWRPGFRNSLVNPTVVRDAAAAGFAPRAHLS